MVKCENCGAPIKNGVCDYCGFEQAEGAAAQGVPYNCAQGGPNVVINQNCYHDAQMFVKTKYKAIALLLCIFFGFFGAHYFYLGRKGMGILYIFTVGIFYVGWFIDIYRIATGKFVYPSNCKLA